MDIEYIPIDNIHYLSEHPESKAAPVSNEQFLNRHLVFVEQLKTQGFVSAVIDGKGIEKTLLVDEINKCWQSFKKLKVMWNPLIVIEHDSKYYTIVGNQRLTCLRAWGFLGKVPCRISPSDDCWDSNCEVLKLHPYHVI